MKTLSPALQALFSANLPFEQMDLYTITLASGLVLRYTNCQFNVVTGGNTFLCSYSSGGIVIDEEGDSGPRGSWTADLAVGTWKFNVMPRPTDVIGSQPWTRSVSAGILDEATLQVDRGYISGSWPTPTAAITNLTGVISKIFYGRIAEIDFGRSLVTITANDPRELLDSQYPRNLYGAPCRYALFDKGCTLDKNAFDQGATVTGVSTDNETINTTLTSRPDDWFSLGEALFTTGDNSGLRSLIRKYTASGGMVSLIAPMPFQIRNGDHVTLFPGCDKSQSTCDTKFSNLANYGGFPYIPSPETAV